MTMHDPTYPHATLPGAPAAAAPFSLARLTAVVTLAVALGGVLTPVMSALGLRIAGPPDAVAMLARSIARDSVVIALQELRLRSIEETQRLQSYLICVQIRRSDPAAVPPQCNEVQP